MYMKVDYHLHLEEGPYSIGWLAKINEALERYEPLQERHSIDWLMKTQERLQKRVKEGPFTTEWMDLYLEEAVRKGITGLFTRGILPFSSMRPARFVTATSVP